MLDQKGAAKCNLKALQEFGDREGIQSVAVGMSRRSMVYDLTHHHHHHRSRPAVAVGVPSDDARQGFTIRGVPGPFGERQPTQAASPGLITIVECGGLWGQRWETQSMRATTHARRLGCFLEDPKNTRPTARRFVEV